MRGFGVYFWLIPCGLTTQILLSINYLSFPGGSDGEESACNAGDPGSIPGLGRYAGEENGTQLLTSLQKVRASLIAQLVKNLPAMQETQVRFLGREDPLEKEMAAYSNILAWRIPRTEEPGRLLSMGWQELDTT